MGVDEDTAAIVTDETVMEVCGRGSVFLAEADHAVTNAYAARGTDPILISGANVHFPPSATLFDLQARELLEFRTAVEQAQIARRTSEHVSPGRPRDESTPKVHDRNAERGMKRRRLPPTS